MTTLFNQLLLAIIFSDNRSIVNFCCNKILNIAAESDLGTAVLLTADVKAIFEAEDSDLKKLLFEISDGLAELYSVEEVINYFNEASKMLVDIEVITSPIENEATFEDFCGYVELQLSEMHEAKA